MCVNHIAVFLDFKKCFDFYLNRRYFMGTFESTFTYRIYEEREILGFPSETTFNTLCKSSQETDECSKNSVWPIVF